MNFLHSGTLIPEERYRLHFTAITEIHAGRVASVKTLTLINK